MDGAPGCVGSVAAASEAGDLDEALVLADQASHCELGCWGVEPADAVHLPNEGALANHCSCEIDAEGAGILPIIGHHTAEGNALFCRWINALVQTFECS